MQATALKKTSTIVPISIGSEQLLMKARVHEKNELGYTLKPQSGVMMVAARAASCLLEPEVDDQVLICCLTPGEYFILAVLVQANSSQSQISVRGDLLLQSTEGSVSLQAKQVLNTQSARWNALHHEVQLTAHQANFVLHHVSACLERVRYVAESVIRNIKELIHSGVSETRALDERYSLTSKIHHEQATELKLSEAPISLNRAQQMGISADKVMINS